MMRMRKHGKILKEDSKQTIGKKILRNEICTEKFLSHFLKYSNNKGSKDIVTAG